jgi:hypothetical protein
MYAYTAVPFSMLSDCIDWNILISGKNTVILIIDLFLYCLFSWKSLFHVMAIQLLCRFTTDVGRANKVPDVLPPSGNTKSQKRQIYITDGRC